MQTAGHFTPEQLIAAARRAEAQGQPAYAQQFYKYVADHFPAATEAYEARDALYRLTPPPADVQTRPPVASPATGYAHPPQHAAGKPLGDHRPVATPDAAAAAPHSGTRPRPSKDQPRPERRMPVAIMPRRGYRIGRLVAGMLGTIGWLLFTGAVLAVPLMIAATTVSAVPKGIKDSVTSNVVAVAGGTFGALLIGLFAIFAAQVARATFDTADATRALLGADEAE